MEAASRKTTKELLLTTVPFTVEDRARSWRATLSSFAGLVACAAGAALSGPWPLRAAFAILEGLFTVRCFGLYHDALHGALLRGSTLAKGLFGAFGVFVLTPPTVWKETHNYHHAHTAKLVGSHVGSFITVNVAMWDVMTPAQRLRYRIIRNGLTILFGYLTLFFFGMCLSSFLRGPRRFWDSGLALLVHIGLLVGLTHLGGFPLPLWTLVVPLMVACAVGSYLFYAQHNFPDVEIQPRERWSYSQAALNSSSYIEMGPVMRYFTANLGYHHIHHLNAAIPFYRLPEAMAASADLQHPGRTTLKPRDIARCLSLDVWDERSAKMVSLDELSAEPTRSLS